MIRPSLSVLASTASSSDTLVAWRVCTGGLEEDAAKRAQKVLISEQDHALQGAHGDAVLPPRSSPTPRPLKVGDAAGRQCSVTEQCLSFRPVGVTPLRLLGSYCSGKAATPRQRLLAPTRASQRPRTASSTMSSRARLESSQPPQYVLANVKDGCGQEEDAAAQVWSARVQHFRPVDAHCREEQRPGERDLLAPTPSRHTVLSARIKSLTPRPKTGSTLEAKRAMSKTLLTLEKHIGFSLHRSAASLDAALCVVGQRVLAVLSNASDQPH